MSTWILETPFGFNLDMSFWAEILSWPAAEAVGAFFAIFGWPVLAVVFFFMGEELWLYYRRLKYTSKWQWVVLAVDIPPLFIQSPKAVEQIFAHFSGAKISPNIGQRYWLGKKQKWFSLEIISIEGYIQFLIRTEAEFRDLVEAAVYAQYPEAEITEVEDYVNDIPNVFPNVEYDMFGMEFGLADNIAYPIRTYEDFEYSISKDVVFSDPMAAILENFSRVGHGENFWLQILIEPTDNAWKQKGIDLVKKIIANKKEATSGGVPAWLAGIPALILQELVRVWEWNFEPGEAVVKKEEAPGKVMDLSPGKKDTLEAVERKISKIGFRTKIRALYVSRREIFNPSRCFDGFVGSLNQFHVIGRNAITPYSITMSYYAFKTMMTNWKKNIFIGAFKRRRLKTGGNSYIMNIEELATLWHFPLPFVKTPLVQKAMIRRGEPPINLPIETSERALKPIQKTSKTETPTVTAAEPPPQSSVSPPESLPYG